MERELRTIAPGTKVYSSDAVDVGEIAEVGANFLLTRKGWLFVSERYIPFDAVSRIEVDAVYLTVAKNQLDAMAWDAPPAATVGAVAGDGGAGTSAVQGAAAAQTELEVGNAAPLHTGSDVTTPVSPDEDAIGAERPTVAAPIGDAAFTAFQEGTIEVRARHEELIVDAQAHVVEEIRISKTVEQRSETIQDTLRRTRVDVVELDDQPTSVAASTSVQPSTPPAEVATPSDDAPKPEQRGRGRGRRRRR